MEGKGKRERGKGRRAFFFLETKKLGRLKVLYGHPEVLKPRSPSDIVGLRPPNSPAGT